MKRMPMSVATALLAMALVWNAGGGYPHSPGGRVPVLSATRGIAQNGFDHRFAANMSTPEQVIPNKEELTKAFPRWWSKKQCLAYLQATGRFPEHHRVDYWPINPSFIDTDW